MDGDIIKMDQENYLSEYNEYINEDRTSNYIDFRPLEESEYCICGELLDSSHGSCYDHMSNGY